MRSAHDAHAASSTNFPSSSHSFVVRSSAAVAISIDIAADFPAPGSPPASRLRSTSDTATVPPCSSTPSGIGSHNDVCAAVS